jgi:starch phosphorylase
MPEKDAMGAAQIRRNIEHHLRTSLGKDAPRASLYDWRMALSFSLRDLIVEPWFETTKRVYAEKRKRVYYLSMEYLIGRLIEDAVVNLGLEDECRDALDMLGADFDKVMADEPDAALGNGGLGRLAACFIDSMSTLGIAAFGYGVRYEQGLFHQRFEHGRQIEEAEDWLQQRHAWEFERPEVSYEIGFGGQVKNGGNWAVWEPEESVIAQAYDTPIIGWTARWANTLRLWAAKPIKAFDLHRFNLGEFTAAAEPEALARTISRVLYPDDTTEQGKELRLKQEYFFAAASVRDLVRRFLTEHGDLKDLGAKVAIQLNDTHPAIAGPELVRLLVDEHGMDQAQAMEVARECLSYTNHTLLPEALERWPIDLMRRILPRHMQIIEAIEGWHLQQGGTVRIVENGAVKMGSLAFILSSHVNGVSALHTDLVRSTVFADLNRQYPGRIVNETNGITPRRWLYSCNPPLRELITESIGDGWPADLEQLQKLMPLIDDAGFRDRFATAKRLNKERFSNWLVRQGGQPLNPDALFDVQIKRIHEYKRQLMNILETIALWNAIRDNPGGDWQPRVKIFGGKAAPGYVVAKQIIHLINDVARVINADPVMRGRLAVVFPENYNVSMAEALIPAADLSEQISTAGMEASGTGNMKLALNGALTIGTLDGANVEIREHVGAENFFLFGLTAQEVEERRRVPDFARQAIDHSPILKRVLVQIGSGFFSPDERDRYGHLVSLLYEHDYFLVTADFEAYYAKQREVEQVSQDIERWLRMSATNTARMGWFSSDRAIRGYAEDIWKVEPRL